VLLGVLALRILELFIKVYIPFAGNVSVPQQNLDQVALVLVCWLNLASKAALAPVADRAYLPRHVYMLEHKW
jgi:hypothetical protein